MSEAEAEAADSVPPEMNGAKQEDGGASNADPADGHKAADDGKSKTPNEDDGAVDKSTKEDVDTIKSSGEKGESDGAGGGEVGSVSFVVDGVPVSPPAQMKQSVRRAAVDGKDEGEEDDVASVFQRLSTDVEKATQAMINTFESELGGIRNSRRQLLEAEVKIDDLEDYDEEDDDVDDDDDYYDDDDDDYYDDDDEDFDDDISLEEELLQLEKYEDDLAKELREAQMPEELIQEELEKHRMANPRYAAAHAAGQIVRPPGEGKGRRARARRARERREREQMYLAEGGMPADGPLPPPPIGPDGAPLPPGAAGMMRPTTAVSAAVAGAPGVRVLGPSIASSLSSAAGSRVAPIPGEMRALPPGTVYPPKPGMNATVIGQTASGKPVVVRPPFEGKGRRARARRARLRRERENEDGEEGLDGDAGSEGPEVSSTLDSGPKANTMTSPPRGAALVTTNGTPGGSIPVGGSSLVGAMRGGMSQRDHSSSSGVGAPRAIGGAPSLRPPREAPPPVSSSSYPHLSSASVSVGRGGGALGTMAELGSVLPPHHQPHHHPHHGLPPQSPLHPHLQPQQHHPHMSHSPPPPQHHMGGPPGMVGRVSGGRHVGGNAATAFHHSDIGSMGGPEHDGIAGGPYPGAHLDVPGNGGLGGGGAHPHMSGIGWDHPGGGKELSGVYYHDHLHEGTGGAPGAGGGYGHEEALGGSYHGPPAPGPGSSGLGGGSFHPHDDLSVPPYGPPGAAPPSHQLHYGDNAAGGYGYGGGADGGSPYMQQAGPIHHHTSANHHQYHHQHQHGGHQFSGRGGGVQMNAAGQPIRIGNTSLQMAAGTRPGARPT